MTEWEKEISTKICKLCILKDDKWSCGYNLDCDYIKEHVLIIKSELKKGVEEVNITSGIHTMGVSELFGKQRYEFCNKKEVLSERGIK